MQNRVNPFGEIIRTPARGAWTGTRGILHNDHQELIRPFKLKTWITCKLEFKGRKRIVMSPDRYTELFFLDEATSFAAGHRPCCECRRSDFDRFKSLWIRANPEYGFHSKTRIREIDAILHSERISRDRLKISFEDSPGNIPDGTFIVMDGDPFLVSNGHCFLWSPFGYETGRELPRVDALRVLTPRSVVNTFRVGYRPQTAIP